MFNDEAKRTIVNYLIPCVMMFVVQTAKLFSIFLVSNYNYIGDRSFVTIFIHKLVNYPLFFNKNYGANPTRMAIKFLHADFVRIIKHLCLRITLKEQRFEDLKNLIRLIDIVYEQYLNK